eukprot:GHRQ01007664.1.p1 GENE.GHRQ01007664.1~~GHRQ01007664.1.p1  ORF type:complete len:179 (+),score=22.37 GHRQ01007664.1:127-663(+)
MNTRMSEVSSPLSRRGARKAAARLSRLFTGNAPTTIKAISPSDSVCQEVAAPAVQEASLQDSNSFSVTPTPVTIVLARRVAFGDRIAVVGNTQALGSWSVLDGVPLQWQEGDVWRGEVALQPGMHEFKVSFLLQIRRCVIARCGGSILGCVTGRAAKPVCSRGRGAAAGCELDLQVHD